MIKNPVPETSHKRVISQNCVGIPNLEIRLRRRRKENIQPDNQQNHPNSSTYVIMGKKYITALMFKLT